MRTYHEIRRDVRDAANIKSVDGLMRYVHELELLELPNANALAHQARGMVLMIQGDSTAALDQFRRALRGFEELLDQSDIASVTSNIGFALLNQGNLDTSLEHFQTALSINIDLNDRGGEATVASNIGTVFVNKGQPHTGMEYYERALALYRLVDDRNGVARVTSNIGKVHFAGGQRDQALECYKQALVIHEELGDVFSTAFVCVSIGRVMNSIGEYSDALHYFQRALSLHQEISAKSGAAYDLIMIGTVYYLTGSYPLALEQYRRAYALYEEIDDVPGLSDVELSIANLNWSTGDYSKALECNERALTLKRAAGDSHGEASCLNNIGNEYKRTGEYALALEYYHRSLLIQEKRNNHSAIATTKANIVGTYLAMGSLTEAEELLVSLDAMHIDSPEEWLLVESQRAKIQELRGDLEAATRTLQLAVQKSTDHELRSATAELHRDLRDLAQKRNDFAGYIEHNNEYQRISEEIRGKEATQKLAMMEAERKMESEMRERDKERALLYGALPKSIADRMIRGEKVTGDHYEHASVIFLDIVGFTSISDKIPPGHVVHLLSQIFSALDDVCKQHAVTKIKTIGDSYMAVAGVPEAQDDHAQRAARAALAMLATLDALEITMPPDLGDTSWTKDICEIQARIGVHCGPVTAGVIGTERLQYDVWGDTVNVASRMESTAEPSRIHVSEAFAIGATPHASPDATPHAVAFTLIERGTIIIKGTGEMHTYWLEGP